MKVTKKITANQFFEAHATLKRITEGDVDDVRLRRSLTHLLMAVEAEVKVVQRVAADITREGGESMTQKLDALGNDETEFTFEPVPLSALEAVVKKPADEKRLWPFIVDDTESADVAEAA